MSTCPSSAKCAFHQAVEPSVIKKIKYASFYPYCNSATYETCALHAALVRGESVRTNLLPDGSIGDYAEVTTGAVQRFLIVEDSPIFAALAANAIRSHFPGAEITRHTTFDDAFDTLTGGSFQVVVCGYGLGGDRTAHDVRELTDAPIVVMTGRPGGVQAPRGARVVEKSAGPEALVGAIRSCLA